MGFKLQYSKDHAEAELGVIVIGYHEALRATLGALAAEKGTEDLAWFDQLHQDVIKAVKGTTAEGVSLATEAKAVGQSVEVIDHEFKSVRAGLLKDKQ
ncbi:hypothetical protein B9J07_13055 [Sinorhizobium sp. LM21]|uniref:hypothetical protein n=1 Tax=Sinorhizobium phage phiLM21 TaxID=1524882 RepID=UPI0004E5C3C8|nr:hypothetical protein AWJ26_gp62 [Sinorhizobium phage phiLM21]AII27798.1 hypothetical protein phiLM21_p047 [Sinorhizobium phage phiLM21]OWZ93563.1 hypothetical protein B9J07_13055 [Sinorhizobium sp. LM21]